MLEDDLFSGLLQGRPYCLTICRAGGEEGNSGPSPPFSSPSLPLSLTGPSPGGLRHGHGGDGEQRRQIGGSLLEGSW